MCKLVTVDGNYLHMYCVLPVSNKYFKLINVRLQQWLSKLNSRVCWNINT